MKEEDQSPPINSFLLLIQQVCQLLFPRKRPAPEVYVFRYGIFRRLVLYYIILHRPFLNRVTSQIWSV